MRYHPARHEATASHSTRTRTRTRSCPLLCSSLSVVSSVATARASASPAPSPPICSKAKAKQYPLSPDRYTHQRHTIGATPPDGANNGTIGIHVPPPGCWRATNASPPADSFASSVHGSWRCDTQVGAALSLSEIAHRQPLQQALRALPSTAAPGSRMQNAGAEPVNSPPAELGGGGLDLAMTLHQLGFDVDWVTH